MAPDTEEVALSGRNCTPVQWVSFGCPLRLILVHSLHTHVVFWGLFGSKTYPSTATQ